MAEDEAACWCEFVQNMPPTVLTSGDRWTLEQAARLQAKSRREGLTGAEIGHLRGFLVEMGATPAARSKITGGAPEEKAPGNPWDVPGPAAPGARPC